ncbi:hypothetical protein HanXRQr2_Chr05g0215961 [Helianthus annuus]|uniref:Uncharacterized protein n=1 Tax=Helianthus annuus TaxID=4232 RepID=A0A9K3J085_HELAN|nr:hypothetical protein HanXRQr2_Chr05g0215961 [Helianthus annuus]KAJ0922840.1 hypothetical protein HanPSC8_Chr05g0208501 [Helianthus annuus]
MFWIYVLKIMECFIEVLCVVQCDWWLGSWYGTRPAMFPHVVFWGCDSLVSEPLVIVN